MHNIKNLRGWEQCYLTDSQGGGTWTAYMILDKWDVKPFGDNGGGDVAIRVDSPNSPPWWGEDRGCGCGGQPCDDMRGGEKKTHAQEEPLDWKKNGRGRRDVTMRRRHKAQYAAHERAHLAPSMPHVRRDRWVPGAHPNPVQPALLHLWRKQ